MYVLWDQHGFLQTVALARMGEAWRRRWIVDGVLDWGDTRAVIEFGGSSSAGVLR